MAQNTPQSPKTISFTATDVTGTHSVDARDMQASVAPSAAARTLASKMALPPNVPWVLRDDANCRVLNDDKPLGEQITPGANVTLAPAAHLGAG